MDNIKVAIRVRPLLPKDHGHSEQWDTTDERVTPRNPPHTPYYFDHVFGTSATTSTLYEKLAEPIVEGVMDGINGTIFAYGQTASGKTFTMMGEEPHHPGVILKAASHIFSLIQERPDRDHIIRASYLEIYNESLTDLLRPEKKHLNLRIGEIDGNFVVHGLSEEPISLPQDIYQLIEIGEKNRTFGSTNANEHSSRSHTIFKLTIESRVRDEELSDGTIRVASLSLVDLAGSERVSATGATGKQFKEGTNINLSLHVLGRVISKLSEGNTGHVPYRDSKLTSILQPSIGGNSKTAIICTINPCERGESISTIQFASRAKRVKNQPVVNELVCGEDALRKKLKSLEKENGLLKQKLEENLPDQECETLTQQLAQFETQKLHLEGKLRVLENWIVRTNSCDKSALPKQLSRRRTMCPSLLSRDTTSHQPWSEAPPPTTSSLTLSSLKSSTKSVSFAPRSCDESFKVHFTPTRFMKFLNEQEVGSKKKSNALDGGRGRPSFLPSPKCFEDSLNDTQESTQFDTHSESCVVKEEEEEIALLRRECADLVEERATLRQEVEEKGETIRGLEDDLLRELEEKLLEKSQLMDPDVIAELGRELELANSKADSAVQERLVMEEELKKALDRCKELEQSSVPAVDGVDIFECYEQEKEEYLKQLAANERQIASLTEDHSAARRKVDKMKEQYDNDLQFLQELVTSLKAGLAAAKASIEETVVAKKSLELRLTESDQRLQVAKGTIDSHSQKQVAAQCLHEENVSLRQDKDTLAKEVSDLKEELVVAEQEKDKAMNEKKIAEDFETKLEIEKTKLLRELNGKNSRIEELDGEVVSVQAQLDHVASTLDGLHQEKDALIKEVSDLKEELVVAEHEKDKAMKEKKIAEDLETKLKIERTKLLGELKGNSRIEELDGEVVSLQGQLENSVSINGLSQEKDALIKEVSDLKEDLVVAEQEKDKERKIAEDFETQLEIETTKLHRELKGKNSRIEELDGEVVSLQAQLDNVTTTLDVNGLSQEKDALIKEVSDLKEELIVAEQEKDKAMKEKKISEDFETQLEIEKTKLLCELKGKNSRIEELDGEIVSLQGQLDNVASTLDGISQDKDVMTKELSDLKEELVMAEQEKDKALKERKIAEDLETKLEIEKSKLLREIKGKNSRIEELDGEVVSLQGQLDNAASCTLDVNGLSQEKDALMKEVSDLKEELVVAEQEKDKAMNEKKIAEDFETKLEIERTKLLRELKEKNSRIEELDGEVVSLQGQLENVASCTLDVNGLSQEKDALIKEVSDLKEELVVAEQEKDKAIKEKKISEDFETKLEIERTKLLRELKGKNSRIEELDREVVSLQAQLENVAPTLDGLSQEKDALIKEVSDLKEELVVAEQEKETAMKEKKIAEDFETKLEIERIKLLRELKGKNSRIKELDGEVVSLQGQLDNAASTLDVNGLSQEKDALIKKVSDLKEELILAEQEKDKAIKEKKISEDFETKLEIERTKLLRELKGKNSRIEELDGEVVSLQGQLDNAASVLNVNGLSQEKDALTKEVSDLKEELIIAEQEKDKAMKERKIAEDFETQLLREMKEKDEKIEYLESQLNQKEHAEKVQSLERARGVSSRQGQLDTVTSSVNKENHVPESEEVASIKRQLRDMCKLRTADLRQHRFTTAELEDTLEAVRRENRKLVERIQIAGSQPAMPKYPTTASSGVITDMIYHHTIFEHEKLKKTSDKEREEMKRYRSERNSYRTKFFAVQKYCNCSAIERAQEECRTNPDFKLT
ncbi:uncharacterized protein LOC135338733 isoform X3 [Halichondria panicea]|uniref:uncharacterized protein LOC135338733 isoform X3 n=1 Tax=Halichondria panicea TaxID=6063 RepID=UPI00312B91D9